MTGLFQRTGSANFPEQLKVMTAGPPKSGKTSLLGTVPNIVIADTEPHANNLASVAHLNIPFVTITSTMDLQNLRMVLADPSLRAQAAQSLGLPKIEAVAIDTVDTLQKIMKKERLAETRSTQFMRDDWGWIKVELESILQGFLALPMHVFLVVHTKTKEVGGGGDGRTVVLPNLEGAIAEDIAGMVGYSLGSFRKQEIRPDGTSYTKYWLRTEGDETYEFLGNRAAGRLPDVIEPHFDEILKAAKAGHQAAQAPQAPAVVAPQAAPVQTPVQPEVPAPVAPGENNPTQVPGQPEQPGTPVQPGDEEPVNAAGLQFLHKVYDAIGMPFVEDFMKTLNLGQARDVVRMWRAIQSDHAEGKSTKASPQVEMQEYLSALGFLPSNESAAPAEPKAAVEPKVDGTIEEVKAYVVDDLTKIQEAYDLESSKDKPRKGLIDHLVSVGAQVQTPAENQTVEVQPAVTQDEPVVDDSSVEQQAMTTITEALGEVEVISDEINANALCEECGNKIDDVDLATLGKTRFGRILCVTDYIAEGKKPATA